MATRAARSRAELIAAIVLLSVLPLSRLSGLLAQTRSQRGASGASRTGTIEGNRGTPSATPGTISGGVGSAGAPNQGYVVMPGSSPAGTASPALIPSDPLDRAYWELYDSDKQVTISGKITKVTWTDPNTYIFVNANGVEWAVESSFIHFRQANVNPAVRVGQTITVSGYLPKDEPPSVLPAKSSPAVSSYLRAKHLIRAGEITTEYGQKLAMGKPPSEKEMNERLKCTALGC